MSEIIEKPMSADEYFMRIVYQVAERSKDPSSKIGSVIVKDGSILSTGFNNFPSGVKDYKDRYYNRKVKYDFVVHSEANAICLAAKNGISLLNSKIYTTYIPCNECAKLIIQSGIKEVVVHSLFGNMVDNTKWKDSIEITKIMFEEAGIKIEFFDKRLDLTALCFGDRIAV